MKSSNNKFVWQPEDVVYTPPHPSKKRSDDKSALQKYVAPKPKNDMRNMRNK